ncbi:MAG: ATP-binding domain-containing protein [Bacteroidales bacterium]|nr:ATP-binding domain-containing protein [Bacteroidales bacterium]
MSIKALILRFSILISCIIATNSLSGPEITLTLSPTSKSISTGISAQYQDFAILYRTNSQSRVIEEQLRRRNIPYMIYSGNSFFDRLEVKDMMAYFKLCVNPQDDESFKRVVNRPARGIGGTTIAQLEELARIKGTSLFKAGFEVPKVKPFCEMINKLAMLVQTTDAHSLAVKIAEDSSLYAFYKADTSMEGLGRTANIEELLNSVAVFVEDQKEEVINNEEIESEDQMPIFTLGDFLEDTSLLSNIDVSDDEETNNKVALMTVHSAKGLEFPYVYVVGLEENLFPSMSMLSSSNDIEEERRLFYVAITRAEKAVSLSYATERMRNGKRESNPPSRFIREIDQQYLDRPLFSDDDDDITTSSWGGFGSRSSYGFGSRSSAGARSGSSSPYGASSKVSYFKSTPKASTTAIIKTPPKTTLPVIDKNFQECPMTDLRAGMRIEHNRFGAGTILELSGTAPDMKANIDFDQHGKKLLILKYAKLRPLG